MKKQLFLIITLIVIALGVVGMGLYNKWQDDHKNDAPNKALFSVQYGNKSKPKVTIYTDPLCDKCADFHEQVVSKLKSDYADQGKIHLDIRPLAIINEGSAALTELAMCGNEQGNFLPTYSYILKKVNRDNGKSNIQNGVNLLDDFNLQEIAKDTNNDPAKLEKCVKDQKYDDQVRKNDNIFYDRGFKTVPLTFIEGSSEPTSGAVQYGFIKQKLDAILK